MSEVIAKILQDIDRYTMNLEIKNTSNTSICGFGLSALTSRFPIAWDSIGTFIGEATLTSTTGLDSNVIYMRFSDFNTGKSVRFSGIDPEFNGDYLSAVRSIDIEGATAYAQLSDGSKLFGHFEVDPAGDLTAVLTS